MIIDDSAVVRETLSSILSSEKDFEVIAVASNPVFALKKLETLTPDVITLDIEMPQMDGLSFLKELMRTKPIPVVICSSVLDSGSANALTAMQYGAVEMIQKPKMGTKQFLEDSKINICDAVRAAYVSRHKLRGKNAQMQTSTKNAMQNARNFGTVPSASTGANAQSNGATSTTGAKTATGAPLRSLTNVQPKLSADVILEKAPRSFIIDTTEKICVVGASTGGTEALKTFLEMLPFDAPGIVIVQHMPENFTKSFAERLDRLCKVSVSEAKDNDPVVRGRVLIAPGNKHTILKRSGARYYVEIKDGPLVSRHRPSVDVLFRSASRYAGQNAVGVIMTGMGDDGAKGMLEMHEAGAYTIAQDEETCIVFGMPQEAIKLNAVDCVLPLQKIASEVIAKCK